MIVDLHHFNLDQPTPSKRKPKWPEEQPGNRRDRYDPDEKRRRQSEEEQSSSRREGGAPIGRGQDRLHFRDERDDRGSRDRDREPRDRESRDRDRRREEEERMEEQRRKGEERERERQRVESEKREGEKRIDQLPDRERKVMPPIRENTLSGEYKYLALVNHLQFYHSWFTIYSFIIVGNRLFPTMD